METFETWVRLFELQRYYSWIVDRFHLSTQVYQARQGRHYDFGWLEDRLLPLGFTVVHCIRQPETFSEARQERLRVSGKPSQYDDLSVFVREQEEFSKAVGCCRLPVCTVDMTDGDVGAACEKIADWLGEIGRLGMEK